MFAPSHLNNNVALHRNLPGVASEAPPGAGHRTGSSKLFLATDTSILQDINPDTLESLGSRNQSQLHPDLDGPLSCAHPQRDPKTGDLFNVNLHLGRSPTYRLFRVSASTGITDILAAVSGPDIRPAYIHSFFLTENYLILCIPSSHFHWDDAKILWERNLLDAMKPFDKSNLCRWIVVDRHGKGVVARFSTPAAFFFHSINAFEEHVCDENIERTEICMDYIHFDTTDIMLSCYYDVILNRNDAAKKYWLQDDAYERLNPRLVRQRFTLPLSRQTPREAATATGMEVFSIPNPHAGELPTMTEMGRAEAGFPIAVGLHGLHAPAVA
ncbi:hypothetical protein RJ55_05994 [Drechmeria coniospora]|nr:hypothetical protein RJ55_05994 [Drechmeria coniospora]